MILVETALISQCKCDAAIVGTTPWRWRTWCRSITNFAAEVGPLNSVNVPAIGRHAHRLQVVRECRRRACSRAAAATPATLRPDLAELRPPRRLKPPSTAHGANTIAATALPAIRLEPRAVAAAKTAEWLRSRERALSTVRLQQVGRAVREPLTGAGTGGAHMGPRCPSPRRMLLDASPPSSSRHAPPQTLACPSRPPSTSTQ